MLLPVFYTPERVPRAFKKGLSDDVVSWQKASRSLVTGLRWPRIAHAKHGRRPATDQRGRGASGDCGWRLHRRYCTERQHGLPGDVRKQSHICSRRRQLHTANSAVMRDLRWHSPGIEKLSLLRSPITISETTANRHTAFPT